MGMGLLSGLILLVLIFIFATILLFYSIKKKLLFGGIISVILLLGITYCFLITNLDEGKISNKDVVADLKHLNIQLKDKFKITSNKVTGMPERFQETEILLSPEDKKKLIDSIKFSSNFKIFSNEKDYLADTTINSVNNKGQIINYSYLNSFHREKYSLIDNYPTRITLILNEKSNTLKYQRIED